MSEQSARDSSRVGGNVAYDVPELSFLRVDGQDAIKVLNGLCTANLKPLAVDRAAEAFFTDDRGRVMAHVMVVRDEKGAYLVGQLSEPEKLVAHIDRFIFREDAAPRDVTKLFKGRLLDGPLLSSRLASMCGHSSENSASASTDLLVHPNCELLFLRLPMTSPGSYLCLAPANDSVLLESVLSDLNDMRLADSTEEETRRIENFWPRSGREITDRTLPQELDRDALAVSFNKGCYLGQETVARLDAMGEVQKKLCLVQLDSRIDAQAGAALIHDGKEVGKLTSIAPYSCEGFRAGLAYMRRGSFAPGSPFELDGKSGQVIAHP